jgi:twitching motility protein PilJ
MSMAFSFKFPWRWRQGKSDAPMTVAEAFLGSAGAEVQQAALLPAFLAQQPVVQQMKTLGGIFVPCCC